MIRIFVTIHVLKEETISIRVLPKIKRRMSAMLKIIAFVLEVLIFTSKYYNN
jgi:hypothetical protein